MAKDRKYGHNEYDTQEVRQGDTLNWKPISISIVVLAIAIAVIFYLLI